MKTLRIETETGGIFILEECTALGMEHIAHSKGIYKIEDTDKITEVK